MTIRQICSRSLYILLAAVLIITALIGGQDFLPAFADYAQSTNVLDDLQKDGTFNINDYPRRSRRLQP